MTNFVRLLTCATLALPQLATAVEFTEIAWMGSADSANQEWIELYAAESIDVTDWTISDGNNLSITLDGTLPAGVYSVLERTSDSAAPGTAWQIYTGSLVNTGATLTLRDAAGGVVDRVVGGADWESIGGDNETKDTAQLINGVWRTAPATPGRQPDAASVTTTNNTTSSNSSNSTAAVRRSTSQTNELTLPGVTLQLDITAPTLVHVNQPVSFDVTPSGVGDAIAGSLHYTWNFGAGDVTTGKEVTHAYAHPGNYVVVVEGTYKRQQQFARHEIVVLPVGLELVAQADGSVAIQNTTQTEIDISGYRLVGADSFTFPDYTILLPQSQIIIDHEKFSNTTHPQMVALYDQADQPVSVHTPAVLRPSTLAQAPIPPTRSVQPRPTPRISAIDDSPAYRFVSATNQSPSISITDAPSVAATATAPTQVAAVASATLPTHWPRFALVGVLLLGVLAVYLVPRRDDNGIPLA